MTGGLDRTHDPSVRSWVESAGRPGGDFPIQNLPLGVFRRRAELTAPRIGVAIGDRVLDVGGMATAGVLDGLARPVAEALRAPNLNPLMALGRPAARTLRAWLFDFLREDGPGPRPSAEQLPPIGSVELMLPVEVGDYTDFYASIFHATNVGGMFRPDSPLLPNYKFVPIGYHGRASSIVVGGTPIRRPFGQTKDDAAPAPVYGPSRTLDYECELAAYVAEGTWLGRTVPIAEADRYLFGVSLLNDWSARDVQRWEYQPLGPFLAKNFATSVSPWIVTLEALEPFRVPAFDRPAGDPAPLPYLASARDRAAGGLAIRLEVSLATERMRAEGLPPYRLSSADFSTMYWTLAQLLTHHTSNGCNLRPGDLLGSGTVSGPTKDSRGSMLELSWRGTEPIALPTGEQRRFLEDGDEVVMRGFCERTGFASIGLGECRGIVLPA